MSPATPPTAQQTQIFAQHDPPPLPTSPSSQPPRAKKARTSEIEHLTTKAASATTTTTTTMSSETTEQKKAEVVVPSGLQNPAATVKALQHEEVESCVAALQVKRMSEKAKVPTRGSEGAAGLDLYSAEEITIPARSRALVPTHIHIACPPGTYGRVAPRSGLSVKHGLHAGAGVIDADYRGEVKVLLFNLSDEDYTVNQGERCAQLVLERCVRSGVVDVGEGELVETVRGVGGFGSTGQ